MEGQVNLTFTSFSDLDGFAAKARAYRSIRRQNPTIPARYVAEYLDDPGIAQNIEQYVCRHEWPAVEECERSLCSLCGMDGDG